MAHSRGRTSIFNSLPLYFSSRESSWPLSIICIFTYIIIALTSAARDNFFGKGRGDDDDNTLVACPTPSRAKTTCLHLRQSLNKSDGLFNIAGLYLKSSLPWMDGPCLDRAGKDGFSLGAIWLSVGDWFRLGHGWFQALFGCQLVIDLGLDMVDSRRYLVVSWWLI